MNLRIGDAPGLVAFMHEVVSTSGKKVLSTGGYHVVDVAGRLFYHAYHATAPLEVGGRLASLAVLVRSEGLRRYPEVGDAPREPPSHEIFEWAGSFFGIDDGEPEGASVHASLEAATGLMLRGRGAGMPESASPRAPTMTPMSSSSRP